MNTAIANGVAYIDTQQNLNGSYGGSFPGAETGMALTAYGVLANGNFSSLSASYQTHVQNAITWLLGQQNVDGSWSTDGYQTYDTGLALTGLSPFVSVNAGIPAAIANGRTFLTNDFQGPVYTGCVSTDGSPTAYYCGGWNYDSGKTNWSDESNTGYAMTGLSLTGGMPLVLQPDNTNWQHHVQEITSNPFAARNDGGGDYKPSGGGFCGAGDVGNFCSNAKDTGSLLFGLAGDNVPAADPHVVAGLKIGQDVLDVYELTKANAGEVGQAVYHTGATEDGSCDPAAVNCDWGLDADGGYHYSLFTLTKGLGDYIPQNLSDATNWYAKVVDLLLSQQNADGSWPRNGRDDATVLFATGLSVASLGLVAVQPQATCSAPTQTSVTGTINDYNTPTLDSLPEGIVCGPDGNLWFTEEGKNKIGKVTSTGVFTEYNLYPPRKGAGPEAITVGPDNALWFTEASINRIGRITTGGTITDFKVPGNPQLEGITTGPDGNLWFADNNHAVWRMTPTGTFTQFTLAKGHGTEGIVTGPDRNIWFTEPGASRVGNINTTGTVINEFALASGRGPTWITNGPDSRLWFSETTANKIGAITTTGTVSEYPIPTANSEPGGIVTAPDTALYFTEESTGKIGRITAGGTVTNEYVLDNPHADGPIGITNGPCGLWITAEKSSEINQLAFPCTGGGGGGGT